MVGIKPTKLWRLTPLKLFRRFINDRHMAVDHPHDQREKQDIAMLFLMMVVSTRLFLYSYGVYEPKAKVCPGPEPPASGGKNKKCPKKKGAEPCGDQDGIPVAPCPSEIKLAEKKH